MKKLIFSAFIVSAFLLTACSSDDDSSPTAQQSGCQTCSNVDGSSQFCQNDDGSIVTVSPQGQENVIDTKGLSFAQFIEGLTGEGYSCEASSKQTFTPIDESCSSCKASGGTEVDICDIGDGKYTVSIAGSVPAERSMAAINAETFEDVINYYIVESNYTCL